MSIAAIAHIDAFLQRHGDNRPLSAESRIDDETSALCHWHVPETHALEAWSDARAFDGTLSVQQPLIAPLYDGKSAHEVLQTMLGDSTSPSYDIVRGVWKAVATAARTSDADFEKNWRTAVHDGFVAGSAFRPVAAKVAGRWLGPIDRRDGRRQG